MGEEKLNGFLLLDKEVGISSYDVIRKLKRVLPRKQKIGHAGTLDPFASGLLIIMLGKATKQWDSLQQMLKTYEVKAEFGYETDTQDPTGEKIKEVGVEIELSGEALRAAMLKFTGEFEQMPPIYSAKKVDGKRAYKLAREGKEVKLKPKKVCVERFVITSMKWPMVTFEVDVSSGTYIRSLIVDVAKEVGSAATAVELRRTAIGHYFVESAIKSSDIAEGMDFNEFLITL